MERLSQSTVCCGACGLDMLRNEPTHSEVQMQVPQRKTLIALSIKLFSLMMILPLCSSLQAQSFYGSIVGTVTDATGAVVPNAKVTATNSGTSELTTVTSDAGGKFSFVNLVPATYKVDVTKASFKQFIQDQVTVEV